VSRVMGSTLLLLAVLINVGVPIAACSIFAASVDGRSLFGSNVDDGNPHTYYEIVPAADDSTFGYITFGFNDPQGGLNEAGLAFDTNAVGEASLAPHSELPRHPGGPIGIVRKILQTADTVDRALEIAEAYSWGDSLRNQWFFADSSGDAVVISAGSDGQLEFTRKPPGDGYLLSTNINRAGPVPVGFCWRYRTIDRMLHEHIGRGEISVALFTEILDAAHQEAVFLRDGVLLNTVYSNIFDLESQEITLYYWFQFDSPLTLRLQEELAKGAQRVRIRDLFPATVVQEAAAIQAAHLERVEQLRVYPWLQTTLALCAIVSTAVLALLRSR